MDFYITKYQGKPMESLTPLFQSMTDGVHRLERQEEQEEAEAESARKAAADETGLEPARKQQKTMEDIARRARRLTIRLASMANRCFWVSAAELTVHILTDGDCLQSHNNITIFTRQLQWALQECKKQLNREPAEAQPKNAMLHVQAVAMHVAPRRDQDLDGVYFLDMPWILYEGTKLHRMAEATWPDGHGRYARLFAMGVDAYRLQARLYLLRNLQDSTLPGVTGTLRLDGARLVRESDWAVFRNGEAIPVPRVGEGRVDSTQY